MREDSKILIDLQSFRKIYDLYYESLCKFLSFYTKDKQIVEDIIQDIFVSLWEKRNVIDINYLKTYLFQSAKNKMLNHLRDERNHFVILEKWFEQQKENKILEKDKFDVENLLNQIEQAINTLPQKCKEIFMLSKIENLTYKQIAEIKQISLKTVENQMGIALKKIRDFVLKNPFLLIVFINIYFS